MFNNPLDYASANTLWGQAPADHHEFGEVCVRLTTLDDMSGKDDRTDEPNPMGPSERDGRRQPLYGQSARASRGGQPLRVLANRWAWFGVAIAIGSFVPNIAWQANNGFATLEFVRTLRHEVLVEQGRGLFVAGQLLYFHPIAVAVWASGLVFAFTKAGRATRPFALQFLAMCAFLFAVGGKPYYLASAYPAVLAAGGVALERWLAARVLLRRILVGSLTLSGAMLGLFTLPALPLRTVDAVIGSLLGWAVPPMALTHDLHGMYGWEEHAEAIERTYQSLPEADRAKATVLIGTYSQASAINILRKQATPRAVSGSMNYFIWGPDGTRGDVLIAYGLSREFIERHYRSCAEVMRINAQLARPWDTDLPVYVCREPLGSMAAFWPELRQYGHRRRGSSEH